MKFTYEVGMRVRSRHPYNGNRVDTGVVTEVDSPDEIKVRWDGSQYDNDSDSDWTETYDLMPDTDEARAQLAEHNKRVQYKIDQAALSLEEAFKYWREAIGLESGHDDNYGNAYYLKGNKDLDLSKFEGLCEQNGWDTSSLYC